MHNKVSPVSLKSTKHGKILAGEKLANLVNRDLFAKIFLANVHIFKENAFDQHIH